MKPDKKAKWIIGAAGVAFSAFVLSQMDHVPAKTDPIQPGLVADDTMTEREKELLSLDWSNFELAGDGEHAFSFDEADSVTGRS
jgi:hypothetical protein